MTNKYLRAMHCTNAVDKTPSCTPCRKRFSTLDLSKIAKVDENEWSCYEIVTYLKKYDDTKFVAVKSGRKIGCSAWGTLRDFNDRWGFELTIKIGAETVSYKS